jgi:hypothetical protein
MSALVRLGWRWDGAVEVRLCAVKNRAVSNGNCVVATRGGEQRNENDQCVTQGCLRAVCRELDSVGVAGGVCERVTKPVKRATGEEPKRRTAGQPPDDTLMVGDGMAGSPNEATRETRQCWRVVRAKRPAAGLAGVRASVVAAQRVTTVARRERRKVAKCGGQTDGSENQRECPRGLAGGGISRVQWARVIPNVCAAYLGTRRRAAPSRASTPRLESRMRENRWSGLEGGKAARSALPTPIGKRSLMQPYPPCCFRP